MARKQTLRYNAHREVEVGIVLPGPIIRGYLTPPSSASSPSSHLYKDMGTVIVGFWEIPCSTDREGEHLSPRETILPIHSGQTPLLYGRNRIRGSHCPCAKTLARRRTSLGVFSRRSGQ